MGFHVNAHFTANPKLNLSAFHDDDNNSNKPCKSFLCDYIFLVTTRNKWMTGDKTGALDNTLNANRFPVQYFTLTTKFLFFFIFVNKNELN